jgi:thiaminase
MTERRKRSAVQASFLHHLLDNAEAGEVAETNAAGPQRVIVAQEIAERVAERLSSRKSPLPPPGKTLLFDYRSME